jgi:fused signal recognition particle receptor
MFLVLGVNGVGKTTTIAKLAHAYKNAGIESAVAASDTFRAAAIDQLKIHGERLGVRVVAHQSGGDPAAVIFDAAESIASRGGGLVLADTAGRLHNKEHLVHELQKIDRIAVSKADENCCKKILVLDATTGQNAARQAEVFHEAVKLDALVLTKYDSTAKGGVLFSIGKELGLPVFRVCFGERYEDIGAFNPETYTNEFLGLTP